MTNGRDGSHGFPTGRRIVVVLCRNPKTRLRRRRQYHRIVITVITLKNENVREPRTGTKIAINETV